MYVQVASPCKGPPPIFDPCSTSTHGCLHGTIRCADTALWPRYPQAHLSAEGDGALVEGEGQRGRGTPPPPRTPSPEEEIEESIDEEVSLWRCISSRAGLTACTVSLPVGLISRASAFREPQTQENPLPPQHRL